MWNPPFYDFSSQYWSALGTWIPGRDGGLRCVCVLLSERVFESLCPLPMRRWADDPWQSFFGGGCCAEARKGYIPPKQRMFSLSFCKRAPVDKTSITSSSAFAFSVSAWVLVSVSLHLYSMYWSREILTELRCCNGIEALDPQRLQLVTLCQVFPVVPSKRPRLIPDRLLWETKEFDRSFSSQGFHLLVIDLWSRLKMYGPDA